MYEVRENPYPLLPRERLELLGAERLSEQELLAILLRTGTIKSSVLEIATTLLKHFGTLENFRRASIKELKEIEGIGPAKAVEIRAMIELGKRIQTTERKRYGQILTSHELGMSLVDEMQDFEQEHLVALYLDGQNHIIEKRTIFIGAVNRSIANPREILYHAVKNMTVGLIVVHNHPSGKISPSDADQLFTQKIREASESLGINFVDHIIVGRGNYFSFQEKN
ncbi:DNA repair protein RadC [Lactococcus nasutitermitis]|uniref:DNA repair protein RadC n=1 Tax=Lactococcus nasutitermitis TaxID=1652957 RepID=A0ABV9JCM0_9LACT|nr:DNA repair protein RadC [Lactococcus nasutitermitis]